MNFVELTNSISYLRDHSTVRNNERARDTVRLQIARINKASGDFVRNTKHGLRSREPVPRRTVRMAELTRSAPDLKGPGAPSTLRLIARPRLANFSLVRPQGTLIVSLRLFLIATVTQSAR